MVEITYDEYLKILQYAEEREKEFIQPLINIEKNSDIVILKEEDDMDLILFDLVVDLTLRYGFNDDANDDISEIGRYFERLGDMIQDQGALDCEIKYERNSQNLENWFLLQEDIWGKSDYRKGWDLYKHAAWLKGKIDIVQ